MKSNSTRNNLSEGIMLYSVEWDDGFDGVISTKWTEDMEFIKGMYHHLISKGHTNVKIMKKTEVTTQILEK